MPDWQKIVRDQLDDLPLDDSDRNDVIAELAGHLEEVYEALLKVGVLEAEAVRRAMLTVRDWKDLQRKIYLTRRENTMNRRSARFWLPSLITLVLSVGLMVLLGFLGLKPGPLAPYSREAVPCAAGCQQTYFFDEYSIWLMVLPLVGALGAFLSRRAGGTSRSIVLAGVFPALAWLIVLALVLTFSSLRLHNLSTITAPVGPVGVITALVFAPAACLLTGVLAYFAVEKRLTKPTLTKLPS
jgi:hypothetical protein